MSGTVHRLQDNQMLAVQPDETVWLSASAGTGKTQVLSSRVLRLLLQKDVEPSQILCLTFTKAGATEMAARINGTLAEWVRLQDIELFARLDAIGAPTDRQTLDRARTLFAAVLDCPGGGLRIDTIHALSQWLLAAFPHEADLPPGTRPMEDRERALLARTVLADLLVDAEREPLGDPQLLEAAADLSLRLGPDEVEAYLLRCAEAREAWFGPGGWQEPMRRNIMRLLGLPSDADAAVLTGMCCDDAFDVRSLRRCHETLAAWDTATGREGAEAIAAWLAADGSARAERIDELYGALFSRSSDAPKRLNNVLKRDPDYGDHIGRVQACIAAVREMRVLLGLVDRLVPALRLGRAFALAWDEAKLREGLIDFDDQIRRAASLLGDNALADWFRYKLDRRFDHVLVDEAQDTNAAQWSIIDALTAEFFAGFGQRGDAVRTLFVVGDYKQAIFRFQGTSPENFRLARERVRDAMSGAEANASMLRSNHRPKALRELGLGRSFRTAQPVLDFVDRAIAHIGPENFGLDQTPDPHVGQKRPGFVALWRPVGSASEDIDEGEPDEAAPDWLSKPDRQMAENIAQQVRRWIDPAGEGLRLEKYKRRATAGDVMVLVRKRRELAGLIVARLYAAGVPVAGVDRLRLGAPLAVRDLMAALQFAAQPLDDLNLANLLTSPLLGWSQEQLLGNGYRERGVRLWHHINRSAEPDVAPAREALLALLALADFEPPAALLHWLLSGPWQGRRKLIARLGREANDPIDELLNAAHAYAASATSSLTGFIHWFNAGEGELKREAGSESDVVRVMTVHGAKGLEAPIVILADATGDPERSRTGGLAVPDPAHPARLIPLPALGKEERVGRIADETEAARVANEHEHWRLLYVAMTRAEEALFVGGALGVREKVPAEKSWFAKLSELFDPEQWLDDPIWSARLEYGDAPRGAPPDVLVPELALKAPLPRWLDTAPAEEPRPPRPLAPSALGDDDTSDPPYPPGTGSDTARRGILIHKLLERLPELPPSERENAAMLWLERNAIDCSPSDRDEMREAALTVVAQDEWADLFGTGSLAEVPITAVLGDRVLAGTVDRLLIERDRVRLIDYKTSRRAPDDVSQVPPAILRQMAAYAMALEATFPGRRIETALLYTAAPRLIPLPEDVLAGHKPVLTEPQ